jgi:hypothetical protein
MEVLEYDVVVAGSGLVGPGAASFAGFLPTATTQAHIAFATCTAASPTPPVPITTTVSPRNESSVLAAGKYRKFLG